MIATFKFPLPPTMNDIIDVARYRGGGGYRASANQKRTWTNKICAIAQSQKTSQFKGKVWVEFFWIVRNFGRDPDNIYGASKFIFDGLVMAKIIKNDNLMVIQSPIIHNYLRGKDSVIVLISSEIITQNARELIIEQNGNSTNRN
jgi:hypothetical protein